MNFEVTAANLADHSIYDTQNSFYGFSAYCLSYS